MNYTSLDNQVFCFLFLFFFFLKWRKTPNACDPGEIFISPMLRIKNTRCDLVSTSQQKIPESALSQQKGDQCGVWHEDSLGLASKQHLVI